MQGRPDGDKDIDTYAVPHIDTDTHGYIYIDTDRDTVTDAIEDTDICGLNTGCRYRIFYKCRCSSRYRYN